MFTRLEWLIAWRYLRARRKEGAISVIALFSLIGILLGVGTLIVVMSVMNGFRSELIDRIIGVQPHVQIIARSGKGLTEYDVLARRLTTLASVTRAAPRMEQFVMASSVDGAVGVRVIGLRKADILTLKSVAKPEEALGSLDNFDDGIALAEGVARKLGVGIGGRVTLITPPNRDTAFGRTYTRRSYPVTYIFRIGYTEYDGILVYLPLTAAQGLLNRRGRADAIEVTVADPDALTSGQSDPVSKAVADALPITAYQWNWKQASGAFIAALDTERIVMFIILSLIILVAALNIISGLIMLVKEKGHNVGIMRTFGMTSGSVMRVFFICGSFIGVVGTILGVIAGILFVTYIHDIQAFVEWATGASVWDPTVRYLTRVPAILHMSDVLMTIGISLGLSLLATLYPARRAARLDPIDALRFE